MVSRPLVYWDGQVCDLEYVHDICDGSEPMRSNRRMRIATSYGGS